MALAARPCYTLVQRRPLPSALPPQRRARCIVSSAAPAAVEESATNTSTTGVFTTNRVVSKKVRISKVPTVEALDWRPATVVNVEDVADGTRCITIDAECSREFVTAEHAYLLPGQLAQVRLVGTETPVKVCVSSAPFPSDANYAVTMKARGDIPAGTTKLPQFFLSVKYPLDLHVVQSETPDLYNLKQGDEVELGPFDSSGMNLRPVMVLSLFPTMLFFGYGKGMAAVSALLDPREADDTSLNPSLRSDVRLYCSAAKFSLLPYKDKFEAWSKKRVKVCSTFADEHCGSLEELWDNDDVEYDPMSTAVIICTEKSAEAELDALVERAEFVKEHVIKWVI